MSYRLALPSGVVIETATPAETSAIRQEFQDAPVKMKPTRVLTVLNPRPRAKTIPAKKLSREEIAAGAELIDPSAYDRPRTRGDCEAGGINEARPCPWIACRHHNAIDVNETTGGLKILKPDREIWELERTCSLDEADRGGLTLDEIGEITALTRERIRQVETRGLENFKRKAGGELTPTQDRADLARSTSTKHTD